MFEMKMNIITNNRDQKMLYVLCSRDLNCVCSSKSKRARDVMKKVDIFRREGVLLYSLFAKIIIYFYEC